MSSEEAGIPVGLARTYDGVSGTAARGGPNGSCATCGEPSWRVGTDVQSVAAVLEAVERHGTRYLDRVFTGAEVADSRGGDPAWTTVSVASLAARFAAKEAAVKALRPVQTGIAWTSVEVVRRPGGWCTLRLHGDAALQAEHAGLGSWSLSFAHEDTVVVATVLAHHTCG